MTTKATHTPTPWTVGDVIDYAIWTMDRSECIANCHGKSVLHFDDLASANAAHIVTCVNSHDALVEALRDVSKRIAESDQWWMGSKDRGGFDVDMIDKALAAINADKPDHA